MVPSGDDPGAADDADTEQGDETDTLDTVDDETVVETASEAAEAVLFSRYDRSEITDFDVTVTYEDYILEVDVYLDAPEGRKDPEQVTEDAALAARSAVDDLLL